MNRCKIIKTSTRFELEEHINKFIADKNVISVSMEIRPFKHVGDMYYACIIYEEWSE